MTIDKFLTFGKFLSQVKHENSSEAGKKKDGGLLRMTIFSRPKFDLRSRRRA